jgi:hypothetical protein
MDPKCQNHEMQQIYPVAGEIGSYGRDGPFIDQLRELMSGIQPPLQVENSHYLVHIAVSMAPLHFLPHPLLYADLPPSA